MIELIGPREQFRYLDTIPTDPEVSWVLEASGNLSDGRHMQMVMASTNAAIRRFEAAAKKLGYETRCSGDR